MTIENTQSQNPLAHPLRIASSLVFLAGAIMAVLHVVAGVTAGISGLLGIVSIAGPAFLYVVGAWILALMLWRRANDAPPPDLAPAIHRTQDLVLALQQQVQAMAQQSAAPALASTEAVAGDPQLMQSVLESIAELRRLVLLTEADRKGLLDEQRRQKKQANLYEARVAIANREWGRAEQYMAIVERELKGDDEVAAVRMELERGRAQMEAEAVQGIIAQVEDLMAMTQWDSALAEAKQFAHDYPKNPEGQALLARVVRERDLYRETMTKQLWDEVKRQAEHRQWRKALGAARRLAEQFPDHRHGQKIAQQLPTLTQNAEIEERQERETQIHDMINRKRFADAMELAEELMKRFPTSPQAQKLRDMMPMLREKAKA